MLFYFGTALAFFLAHRDTGKFISLLRNEVELASFFFASDLRLLRSIKPYYRVTIEDPVKKMALEQKYGGIQTVAGHTSRGFNQSYRLGLLPNDSFVIISEGWCLRYKPAINRFVRELCLGDLTTFDIYYEVSVQPEEEVVYSRNLFDKREHVKNIPSIYEHDKEVDSYMNNRTQSGYVSASSRDAVNAYNASIE